MNRKTWVTEAGWCVLISTLVLLKIALLFVLGPVFMPDTGGYLAFADKILGGVLGDAGLGEGPIPVTLFRAIGYPALLAGARMLAPDDWSWLVVVVQMAVSLVATAMIYRLARAWWRPGLALAVASAQALSLPLLLDQVILTDSLYASLLTIVTCLLLRPVAVGNAVGMTRALVAGICLVLAFLLREATAYLVIAFVPLGAVAGWREFPRERGQSRMHAAAVVILLIGPTLFAVQTYRVWNYQRTGIAVVTTGSQTAVLMALADAARHNPAVFAGDTPVDVAARKAFKTYAFEEVIEVNRVLFRDNGWNAIDIASAVFRKYFCSWGEEPHAMLGIVGRHIRANQWQMTVRPIESLRELMLWSRGTADGFPTWRAVRGGVWWAVPAVVADGICKAMAILIFAAFLFLTPVRLVRGGWTRPFLAVMALWLVYGAFFVAYAMIHLETRYMAGMVPASLLGGLANLIWLNKRLRDRRHR